MRTLLIYYSHTGNNAALATELQRRLGCEVEPIVEHGKRKNLTILLDLLFKRLPSIDRIRRNLRQYDRLILAAPIWAGRVATPIAAMMAREKDHLPEYAFITVCTGPEGQREKIRDELRKLSGKEPKEVTELKVNDLLPPEQKNKIRYATGFRVRKEHFLIFKRDIDRFLQAL